jgi:hypothetical protein
MQVYLREKAHGLGLQLPGTLLAQAHGPLFIVDDFRQVDRSRSLVATFAFHFLYPSCWLASAEVFPECLFYSPFLLNKLRIMARKIKARN